MSRRAALPGADELFRATSAAAALTEVTVPESDVVMPSSTAPTMASPRPVRSATTSAR